MIILAEKLDFFCARISNIRSKTLFWAQKQQSLQKNPVIFLQGLLLSELPELPELPELSAANFQSSQQ